MVQYTSLRASPAVKKLADGSSCAALLTVTFMGDGAKPRSARRPAPAGAADQQPRIVRADGAGTHHDRVAGGPHGVHPVKIGVVGEQEPFARRRR